MYDRICMCCEEPFFTPDAQDNCCRNCFDDAIRRGAKPQPAAVERSESEETGKTS